MKFGKYLAAFKKDLKGEKKMGTLMEVDPKYLLEGFEWDCSQKLQSQFDTIKCRFHRKYLRILKEVDAIEELFNAVHQGFLADIDHLDYYYPYSNESREKRFIQEGEYYPKRLYEELDASESEFLDTILREIERLRPEVNKELIR